MFCFKCGMNVSNSWVLSVMMFCVCLAGKCPSMKLKPQERSWLSSSLSVWLWEPLYPSVSGPWSKTTGKFSVSWRRRYLFVTYRSGFILVTTTDHRVQENIYYLFAFLFGSSAEIKPYLYSVCAWSWTATVESVTDIIQQRMKEFLFINITFTREPSHKHKSQNLCSASMFFFFTVLYIVPNQLLALVFKYFKVTPILVLEYGYCKWPHLF